MVQFHFLRSVPNIKFNVAKVLQSLIPIVDQSVRTLICLFLLDWLLGLVEIKIELTYAICLLKMVFKPLIIARLQRKRFTLV